MRSGRCSVLRVRKLWWKPSTPISSVASSVLPCVRLDACASAPVQELGIALDVVDEIEHLLRRVRNTRAALHCRQKMRLPPPAGVFFCGDSRIIALPMTKKQQSGESSIAQNKKARFDYFIEERIEAGLALQGWEVKSMRAGKAQLTDSFVIFREGEAWLLGSHVSPLNTVSTHVIAEPKRTRKLLHESPRDRSFDRPRRAQGLYADRARAVLEQEHVKVAVGLAKGKKQHDKRDTEKDRDWQRDKSRALKAR